MPFCAYIHSFAHFLSLSPRTLPPLSTIYSHKHSSYWRFVDMMHFFVALVYGRSWSWSARLSVGTWLRSFVHCGMTFRYAASSLALEGPLQCLFSFVASMQIFSIRQEWTSLHFYNVVISMDMNANRGSPITHLTTHARLADEKCLPQCCRQGKESPRGRRLDRVDPAAEYQGSYFCNLGMHIFLSPLSSPHLSHALPHSARAILFV